MLDPAEEVAFPRGIIGDCVDGFRGSIIIHPPDQCLRTVKREGIAAPRHGIEPVGEASFRAGGLVAERQRRPPSGNAEGHALHILLRLLFDTGERMASGFGFNRTDGLAIDE